MAQFISDVLNGVPYGSAFSLVAIGLVLTYRATGVFNFGFAAEAYAAAVVYAELCNNNVNPLLAAGLVVLVIAPVFGAVLDVAFFSRVPPGQRTAKVVMTLGLMVILPQLVGMVDRAVRPAAPARPRSSTAAFWSTSGGNVPILGQQAARSSPRWGRCSSSPCSCAAGASGLPVRAAVESPKLLELSGVDSRWVLRAAWMVSTAARRARRGPVLGVSSGTVVFDPYGQLLRRVDRSRRARGAARPPAGGARRRAARGGLGGSSRAYIPSSSVWYQALVPSLPFFILLACWSSIPRTATWRTRPTRSPPSSRRRRPPPSRCDRPVIDRSIRILRWPFLVLVGASRCCCFVPDNWTFSLTEGASLSIIFLSITLLTGPRGPALARPGDVRWDRRLQRPPSSPTTRTSRSSSRRCRGALIAGFGGWAASLPALRLRGLPVALLTFCLALLGDSLLFNTSWIVGDSQVGINLDRPSTIFGISFSSVDSEGFFVLTVVVMIAVAGFVNLLLRGTTGRALSAVDASPVAAASAGIPVRRMTITVFMLSAAIAGLGGAFYAMTYRTISPTDFIYYYGPTFLVIVITVGATTVEAAICAGMAFALINQAFLNLPERIGGRALGSTSLTIALLSLGAFTYARHPEGIFDWLRRRLAVRVFRAVEHHQPDGLVGVQEGS